MIYKVGAHNNHRVILLDDMSRDLEKEITKTIAGANVSPFTLSQSFVNRVKDDGYQVSDKSLWIFDATYVNEENNTSTLDIAEYLVSRFPNNRDNLIVLLGSDMNDYLQRLSSDGNYDASLFLSRVRALPHVIYGDKRYNNKVNVIINQIQSFAKRAGFETQFKLKSGTVDPQILELARETKKDLSCVLDMLYKIGSKDLKGFNPKTEEERDLINLIETVNYYFVQHHHDLSNINAMFGFGLMAAERKTETSKDEKQKQ